MEHELTFNIAGTNEVMNLNAARLINGGYTGRNKAAVQAHVDELRKQGIKAPEVTPCFFPKSSTRIIQDGNLEVLDEDCSSETEYVIIAAHDEYFITVGSDIFDAKAEGFDAAKSKWLYPNYIAKEVWRYEDIKDHWDELEITSCIGSERELYQHGKVDSMMNVEQLLDEVKSTLECGVAPGTVLYSGTISCLIEGMPFTDRFEAELFDPVLNRRIQFSYAIDKIDWFIRK